MTTLKERTIIQPELKRPEKPSLGDFTRKSVVGAAYRVGASFTLDAIYLTAVSTLGYYVSKDMDLVQSVTAAASDFVHNLEPIKLGRVAFFVVGINFVDYKYDVTNRLDRAAKYVLGNRRDEN